jgi:DNA-binding LacI/PurR family transcriptional regulator
MSLRFEKTSLIAQVLQLLRREIETGRWPKWMPTERALSKQLQVSRRTVRGAMDQLRSEGLISSHVGLGTRVLHRPGKRRSAAGAERSVGLLMPESIDSSRPYLTLWIDQLKSLLVDHGIVLHSHVGRQFFRPGAGEWLERMLKQQPHSCWILAHSNATVQRWFSENKVTTIVAGALHTGIDLPTVYVDTGALGRHATGRLLAAGHNKVAFMSEVSPSPGAVAAERGFMEEVQRARARGVSGEVLHLAAEPQVYRRAVERLLRQKSRVSGIICLNPLAALTVLTTLMSHGVRVPQNMSVITTYGDPFMRFMLPEPTRYSYHPDAFAKKLCRLALQIVSGEKPLIRAVRLMPTFIQGETLGPAPNDAGAEIAGTG